MGTIIEKIFSDGVIKNTENIKTVMSTPLVINGFMDFDIFS